MKSITMTVMCVLAALGTFASRASAEQLQSNPQWNGCCGVTRWPMGPGMMGRGMMSNGMGYMTRRHTAMMSGIPAPYAGLANTLRMTPETISKGAAVYGKQCVSCHGPSGFGDGDAGRNLNPPPGNLAWLSQMPMARWDAYIYWTVAEGGTAFGTGMPAFKNVLSRDEIWAVTAYIQAHLPVPAK
jgi:mono/diheme cytochrome c family protein